MSEWSKPLSGSYTCGCVGPQNGEPLCPCKMRGVKVVNGRYVIPAQDLGPAQETSWDIAYKMMRRTAAEPPRAIGSGRKLADAHKKESP